MHRDLLKAENNRDKVLLNNILEVALNKPGLWPEYFQASDT